MHLRFASPRTALRSFLSAIMLGCALSAYFEPTRAQALDPQLTWVQRLSGTSSQIQGVAYNGSYFVAIGTGFSLTSSDGQNWTYHPVSANGNFYALTYANGTWVGVATTPNPGIFTSADGVIWTSHAPAPNATFNGRDVAYGAGIWVAVAASGIIERSIDNGVTWQLAASPTSGEVTAVTYGANVFMAVDVGGNSMRSSDGLFWTLSAGSLAGGNSSSAAYGVAYGAGVFVITGVNPPSIASTFARSMDGGITWTNLVMSFGTGQLNRIRYQNGRFVAVGNSVGIFTSIDSGVTWQRNTTGVVAISLRDVTYGAGKWVAVGSNGVILTATEDAAVQVVPNVNISSAIRLDWPTQSGASYQVQSSLDLQTWQSVGPSLTGDGNTKLFYDSQDAAQRFYRVIIR